MGLSRGRQGEEGTLEGEEESSWLQRCGYESVREWFFWFLVGSRPTGGLTGHWKPGSVVGHRFRPFCRGASHGQS
ncbi:unnamed protein product [Lasius platythorax]|uniref:Uncharacterized protein n=1 Tax=Lasius platythorax TaxID=488582 RepID=A0AAV2N495_9HYME